MENNDQKAALTESLIAEENKVTAPKPATKTAKSAAKPARTKSTSSAKSAKKSAIPARKAVAKAKPRKKPKSVRDSFTMPENDYSIITTLKKKCLAEGIAVKKSEILRAGLQALSGMSFATLKNQLAKLDEIKVGRPSKDIKK
jgi:hypothetical protein